MHLSDQIEMCHPLPKLRRYYRRRLWSFRTSVSPFVAPSSLQKVGDERKTRAALGRTPALLIYLQPAVPPWWQRWEGWSLSSWILLPSMRLLGHRHVGTEDKGGARVRTRVRVVPLCYSCTKRVMYVPVDLQRRATHKEEAHRGTLPGIYTYNSSN